MGLANNSIEILNTIRAAASEEYQSRIPVATQTNISTIGNSFATYQPEYLEFLNLLMVKIGLTLISSKMFENKLAPFKSGSITNANDIEEIFVNMSKGYTYDPTGKLGDTQGEADGALTRKTPDIKVMYHRQNRQDFYKATFTQEQIKRAFTSTATLESFLSQILNAEMYTPAAYDEYVLMKELLGSYLNLAQTDTGYALYYVPEITDNATAKEFVKTVRKAGMDLTFMSNEYNAAGVMTYTPADEQVLFINKDVAAEIDTELLATAFNSDKVDFNRQVVYLDNFGSLTNCYGILCDKDFFRIYDTLQDMQEMKNGKGLFINYFYHIWQVLSLSKFKNAVAFLKEDVATPPEG